MARDPHCVLGLHALSVRKTRLDKQVRPLQQKGAKRNWPLVDSAVNWD